MRLTQLFVLLIILCNSVAMAQAQEFDGRAIFVTAQYKQNDVDVYNNTQASTLQQPRLSSNMIGYGLNWMKVKSRWTSSSGLSFFYDLTNDDLNRGNNRLHIFSANSGWGYNLLKPNSKWIVAPELSVSLQYQQFTTSAQQASTIILAQNVDHFNMTRWSTPLRFGMQIVRTWIKKKNTTEGFVMRLRSGYQLNDTDRWKYNGAVDVINSGLSTRGFYISLGIGAFRTKEHEYYKPRRDR